MLKGFSEKVGHRDPQAWMASYQMIFCIPDITHCFYQQTLLIFSKYLKNNCMAWHGKLEWEQIPPTHTQDQKLKQFKDCMQVSEVGVLITLRKTIHFHRATSDKIIGLKLETPRIEYPKGTEFPQLPAYPGDERNRST